MAITLNTQGNCSTSVRGSGLGDCVKLYGDLLGIDLVPKGWSISTSGDLPSVTEYKTLIQAGTVIPLNDMDEFEQVTPDNEVKTFSRGNKSKVRNAKPEFNFIWEDKGGCFDMALQSYDSKNKYDLYFKFETGVVFAHDVAETEIRGFNGGMFDPATFKFKQAGDGEMSKVNVQLNSPLEFNTRRSFHTWEELGYDMNLIDGVINTSVSFQTAPTTSTTVNVYVLDDCNRSVSILGLEVSDFTLGGTQTNTTSIDSVSYNSAGYYVLTLDAALESGDTIFIKIAESGTEAAENTSGDLYKGVSPTATVA